MSYLILIIIISLQLVSCNKEVSQDIINPDLQTGLVKDQTINISGIKREYHLFIPQNYNNAPVVILFHGHSSDNNKLLESTPYKVWLQKAENEHIILVVPNGLYISDNEKGWNDCRSDALTNSNADDVQFISQVIDDIVIKYKANSKRVFISGSSNGGHMCIKLAQEIPQKITAFASIVASNSVNSDCSNSSIPISALFMNGTQDPNLPFMGGQMVGNRGEVYSTDETINYWKNRNKTSNTAIVTNFPNINSRDNSSVEKSVYNNGINNTEVILYRIIGGGHTEPSISDRYTAPLVPIILGNQNGDIEMVEEVWAFFQNKTK